MQFYQAFLAIFIVATWAQVYGLSDEPINTWEKFKTTFNKSYKPEDEAIRKTNFEKSLAWVRENNGVNNMTYGINELSDMSKEEFIALNSAAKPLKEDYYNVYHINVEQNLPATIDWRRYFGPIENQGQCGSCWSFAASAVVEALVTMKHGQREHLSKQELLDCTYHASYPNYANMGCRGGHIIEAFRYIHDHGLAESDSYPYTGYLGACRANMMSKKPSVRLSNYFQLVPQVSDAEIMTALKEYGPLGVTIHAGFEGFMYYKGNVIMNWFPNSDPRGNDHAVVIVGYGSTPQGYDYWIIRNSHSASWGDHGYGYILRGGNYMGINNNVNIAVAA